MNQRDREIMEWFLAKYELILTGRTGMIRYKLEHDPSLGLSVAEELEHHSRMARYGQWEDSWWTPRGDSLRDPERRIEREGYVIVDRSEDNLQLEWRRGVSSINADLPVNSVLNVHRSVRPGLWDYNVMISGSVVDVGNGITELQAQVNAEQAFAKIINPMPELKIIE